QALAVVSPVAGTTTDPVRKAMELAPAGPVLVVDTPGIDDEGDVGQLRVQRALRALDEADVAVLVVDAARGLTPFDAQLLEAFRERVVPHVLAWNKADVAEAPEGAGLVLGREVRVSALTGEGVHQLKELLAAMVAGAGEGGLGADGPGAAAGLASANPLVADLLSPGDVVVLVIPLDSAAPKGRLILPQQQVMRDALEAGAFPCATGVEGLPALLDMLPRPPRLVVTDSQVFGAVAAAVPTDVPLTSFSILMARYKGDLPAQLAAVRALEALSDDSTVLIAEGCTHHRQCNDIGTVKLPEWIRQISGANPQFAFTSGREFSDDLSPYAAVVHCGGCMLNRQEMQSRLRRAVAQGVPATNYGMVIAHANGILPRALAPLGVAAS
ncbi:[FeFe] hydrogenase H-cluster maturation GTPase HydF, partial [Parvibacter caecicola]